MVPSPTAPLSLLLATERPAVRLLFQQAAAAAPRLPLLTIPVDAARAASALDRPGGVALAAIDLLPGPSALVLCRALRRRRPDLPLVVVVCCARSATAQQLRACAALRVSTLLDLQTPVTAVRSALRGAVSGEVTIRAQLQPAAGNLLPDFLEGADGEGPDRCTAALLRLVSPGLTDGEIGSAVGLSPHTVHHRLTRLIRERGVRNRVQLAAWAALHGHYAGPEGQREAGRPDGVRRGGNVPPGTSPPGPLSGAERGPGGEVPGATSPGVGRRGQRWP